MDEILQLITKTYGIVGLILISPIAALIYMWKHVQTLQTQLQATNERVNEVHAKRVEDAKQISEKLMDMVQEHAALSKETNLALDRVGDMLSVLQSTAVASRLPAHRRRTEGE